MANEVEILITARDLSGPAFASALVKMEMLKRAARDTGQAFDSIGAFNIDVNKAGSALVQLRSKIQSLGIADIADVNVPQGKIITQLQVIRRIIAQSGISDLIDMNVNPAQLTTQLSKLSSMSAEIPVTFDIASFPKLSTMAAEIIPVRYDVSKMSLAKLSNEMVPVDFYPSRASVEEIKHEFSSELVPVDFRPSPASVAEVKSEFGTEIVPIKFAPEGRPQIGSGQGWTYKATVVGVHEAETGMGTMASSAKALTSSLNATTAAKDKLGKDITSNLNPAVDKAGRGFRGWGGILGGTIGGIGLLHLAIDSIIEGIIAIGGAVAAAAIGVASMAPAAADVVLNLKSIQTVNSALGVSIPPLTGKFQALAQSLAPQVIGDYGGALNLLNKKTGVFGQTAHDVTDLVSTWIAKIDLWNQKQNGMGALLHAGVGFLSQFGNILGHVGLALANLVKADPGTAHFLLDIIDGAARVIDVISKLPGPLLGAAFGIHAIYLWGSVAGGVLGRLTGGFFGLSKTLTPTGGLLKGLIGPMFGVGTATGFLSKSFLGLSGVKWAWIAVAAAAIGYLAYNMLQATTSAKNYVAAIDTALNNVPASQGFIAISQQIGGLHLQINNAVTSLGPLRQTMQGSGTSAQAASRAWNDFGTSLTQSANPIKGAGRALGDVGKAVGDFFASIPQLASAPKAFISVGNNIDLFKAKINSLSADQLHLAGAAGGLLKQNYTLSQSFAIMDLAGVKVGDSLDLMNQKISNLITGYQNIIGKGGTLNNSIQAVNFAALQQQSQVSALNGGWDAFINTITAGETGLLTFAGNLQTMQTNANTTGGTFGALDQASVTLTQSWETSLTSGNAFIDNLTSLAAAAGGVQGGASNAVGLLNSSVGDIIATMLPAARNSQVLTDQLYAMAQRGGYTGADSFAALNKAFGNIKNPIQDLAKNTETLTRDAGNLTQDVKNLSTALGTTLNDAMAQVILTQTGGLKPMNDFANAIKTTGLYSGTTKTAALNLAKQFFSLTGNTVDAHKEFDTFAHAALGLTYQQADALWNQLASKLNPTVYNSGQQAVIAAGKIDNTFIKSLQQIGFDSPGINNDIRNFSNNILSMGDNSSRTQGARAQLIRDLENAGFSAQTAKTFVNNLQGQIDAMHGKTVPVGVVGSGSGTITFAEQNIKNAQTGLLEFHAAGGPVRGRGGPKSDQVLMWGSHGEFMMQADAVSKYGLGFMEAVNAKRFGTGGLVNLWGAPNWMGDQMSYAATMAEGTAATNMISDMKAKIAAAAAAQPAGNYVPGSSHYGGNVLQEQQFAASLFPQYGWSVPYEMPALIALWNQESGWNPYAANPLSNARGIPQNINGWSAYAPGDWANQIRWGESYIKTRYGDPLAAEAHELANQWYDSGGWLKPGRNVMYNGTGGWEHLSRDSGPGGALQLEVSGGSSPFEKFMAEFIREFVRVKGGGSVQRAFGGRGKVL